jgi:hypothetical protein
LEKIEEIGLQNGEKIVIIDLWNYLAVQVPESLKWQKRANTHIWTQMSNYKNVYWSVWEGFLDETIDKNFVIWAKENIKDEEGNIMVNTTSKDFLKKALQEWQTLISIEDVIILAEITKLALWEEAVAFNWHYFEEIDEWSNVVLKSGTYIKWNEYRVKRTGELFWVNFLNFSKDLEYILPDIWLYKDGNGELSAFFRGCSFNKKPTGGVFSTLICWNASYYSHYFASRCAL